MPDPCAVNMSAGTHGGFRGVVQRRAASTLHSSAACSSAQRPATAQWSSKQCLRAAQPLQPRQTRRQRLCATAASGAAAEVLTALQNPPIRDAAATVVTGVGAFAWVKLFNWFASKQVFDQVCARPNLHFNTLTTRRMFPVMSCRNIAGHDHCVRVCSAVSAEAQQEACTYHVWTAVRRHVAAVQLGAIRPLLCSLHMLAQCSQVLTHHRPLSKCTTHTSLQFWKNRNKAAGWESWYVILVPATRLRFERLTLAQVDSHWDRHHRRPQHSSCGQPAKRQVLESSTET